MNKNSKEKVSPEIIAKRLYFANWRSNNKDKVRKYNQKFWLKRANELESKTNSSKH